MKTAILIATTLTLALLTIPSASAIEGPVERCDPRGGGDGLVVGTAECVSLWGGTSTGDVCRFLFGEDCDAALS